MYSIFYNLTSYTGFLSFLIGEKKKYDPNFKGPIHKRYILFAYLEGEVEGEMVF